MGGLLATIAAVAGWAALGFVSGAILFWLASRVRELFQDTPDDFTDSDERLADIINKGE